MNIVVYIPLLGSVVFEPGTGYTTEYSSILSESQSGVDHPGGRKRARTVAGGTQYKITQPMTQLLTRYPLNPRRILTRPRPLRSSKTSSGEAPEIAGVEQDERDGTSEIHQ